MSEDEEEYEDEEADEEAAPVMTPAAAAAAATASAAQPPAAKEWTGLSSMPAATQKSLVEVLGRLRTKVSEWDGMRKETTTKTTMTSVGIMPPGRPRGVRGRSVEGVLIRR